MPPFATSDHGLINFSIYVPNNCIPDPATNISDLIQPITLPVYDWSSGNYVAINAQLASIDWNNLFGFNFDANSLQERLKSIVWPIISLHIPVKIVPHHNKHKFWWYPKDIRRLLSRKAAIWRTLKRTRDPSLKHKYIKIANDCKLAIFNYDKLKEERILQATNLGPFFKFVNRELSSKSGIAPLLTPGGQLSESDLAKAETHNEYFESAFTNDNGHIPSFPARTSHANHGLHDIKNTPTIVRASLGKLKSNSAAGPNRLPQNIFQTYRF